MSGALLSMLAGGLRADGVGNVVRVLADVGAGAHEVLEPRDQVPDVFRPLFRRIAAKHAIPAEVLAAVACVVSRYNANWQDEAEGTPVRVGLLGARIPADHVLEFRARADELLDGDADAAGRVARAVDVGAAQLAELVARRRSLVPAVVEYIGNKHDAQRALALALVYMADSVPADRWQQLRALGG